MFLVSNHIGILILLSFHTSVSLAANHFVTAPPLIPSDVNAVSQGQSRMSCVQNINACKIRHSFLSGGSQKSHRLFWMSCYIVTCPDTSAFLSFTFFYIFLGMRIIIL